jgi:DNA repair photolyase
MSEKLERALSRGRGAISNRGSRFEPTDIVPVDDGWQAPGLDTHAPIKPTQLLQDSARTVITRNNSPDVPFDRSINPYRGCEHGCIYCYARPSHAYLGLSPGLDFETRIYEKTDAARLLRNELAAPGYRPAPIALGANTDAYQPVERQQRITRAVLEVLLEYRHPVQIITKSSLIERDLDLLQALARKSLVQVMISVTSLDHDLSRRLEPRAATPRRRLQTMRTLALNGIPSGVLFAPVIPGLNDNALEAVLGSAREAGATTAGYVFLRLPDEVGQLFEEWLQTHTPLKAKRVMSLVRQSRRGKDYRSRFGERMRGNGAFAELIAQRFRRACRRLGLDREPPPLNCRSFIPPARAGNQLDLFG